MTLQSPSMTDEGILGWFVSKVYAPKLQIKAVKGFVVAAFLALLVSPCERASSLRCLEEEEGGKEGSEGVGLWANLSWHPLTIDV